MSLPGHTIPLRLIIVASTNTHVPAPFWCSVVPVKIPLSSCNQAADTLIEWFGPDELKRVVGGERWWQIRGMEGIDAEWITEKEYLKDRTFPEDAKYTDEEKSILRMEHLDKVLVSAGALCCVPVC